MKTVLLPGQNPLVSVDSNLPGNPHWTLKAFGAWPEPGLCALSLLLSWEATTLAAAPQPTLLWLIKYIFSWFDVEDDKALVLTGKHQRSQKKLNTQLIHQKREGIWLFSRNAGGKYNFYPGNPVQSVESGSTHTCQNITSVYETFPSKSIEHCFLRHKIHPCERCHLYFTTA